MAANSKMDAVEATVTATAKVFHTFELLENIPIKVADIDICATVDDRAERMRDLYRFKQVNSTFREVISRSKGLNVLMFEAESEKADAMIELDRSLNLNPLSTACRGCAYLVSLQESSEVGSEILASGKVIRTISKEDYALASQPLND